MAMAALRLGLPGAAEHLTGLYARSGGGERARILMLLAGARLDHPVIARGLQARDFMELQCAVHAAVSAAPPRYRDALLRLKTSPLLRELLSSSLEVDAFAEIMRRIPAETGTP